MAITLTDFGSDRLFNDGLVHSDVTVTLHTATGAPSATDSNIPTGSWYSAQTVASSDWTEEDNGDYRQTNNDNAIVFGVVPDGASAQTVTTLAIWEGTDLIAYDDDQSISASENRRLVVPAGGLQIEFNKIATDIP